MKFISALLISIFIISLPAIAQETEQRIVVNQSWESLKTKFKTRYLPELKQKSVDDKSLKDPLYWREASCELWEKKAYKLANELYLDSKKVIEVTGQDETIFFNTEDSPGGKWQMLQTQTIEELQESGLTDQEITEKLGKGSDPYISYVNHVIKPRNDKKSNTLIVFAVTWVFLISVFILRSKLPKRT